jgi:LDH2 family malate/lactate/ureidoglycolate dehydrogenase
MSAPAPAKAARRAPPAAAIAFIQRALEKAGIPAASGKRIGELMTAADLAGNDAHGIFRLPQYIRRIEAGGVNPRPAIKVTHTASATALVDGDNGMGHLVVDTAAKTAIAAARECGVAWVGIHRSNHAGAAGVYASLAAEAGMVGIYAAVASANHMAVWGGIDPMLGTNPIAMAVPVPGRHPVVLDIATTVTSYGNVKNHELLGIPMPEGWMVSRIDGRPITDASKSAEGLLLPIGGYKGSGLNILIGLLAGTLNGAFFGKAVVDFNAHPEMSTNTGQFYLALDIARFRTPAEFGRDAAATLDELRASQPVPGGGPIRLPGDERARRQSERARDGIAIPPPLMKNLDALADRLGIARLETSA